MRILVTGSSGHLGEALIHTLRDRGHEPVGLDQVPSTFTTTVGSIQDPRLVQGCMVGIDVVIHAAALHKPHIATHSRIDFVETNVKGTLIVLEAALSSGVSGVIFSSSTSVFGAALSPADEAPAIWVTEELEPIPRNIYGVTKRTAEELCELFYRSKGLPSIVLRISRFFPEIDDDPQARRRFDDLNLKVNEYLHRRIDLEDAVDAHIQAAEHVREIGFGRYVVSATSPFHQEHLTRLRDDAPAVVASLYPDYEREFGRRGWRMCEGIDRVYVNRRAREELGWRPRFDFRHALDSLRREEDIFSPLARMVGAKGYHPQTFENGPYPIEEDDFGSDARSRR